MNRKKVKELIELFNLYDKEVNIVINGDSRNIKKYYDLEVSTFSINGRSCDSDDTLYIYVDAEQKWKIDDPLRAFD